MTIVSAEGKRIEFASANAAPKRPTFSLAAGMTEKMRVTLGNLPYFKDVPPATILDEANAIMRGKVIGDLYTAMMVIVGARALDHPALQVTRGRDISKSDYAG
jgi:hypothetical protein